MLWQDLNNVALLCSFEWHKLSIFYLWYQSPHTDTTNKHTHTQRYRQNAYEYSSIHTDTLSPAIHVATLIHHHFQYSLLGYYTFFLAVVRKLKFDFFMGYFVQSGCCKTYQMSLLLLLLCFIQMDFFSERKKRKPTRIHRIESWNVLLHLHMTYDTHTLMLILILLKLHMSLEYPTCHCMYMCKCVYVHMCVYKRIMFFENYYYTSLLTCHPVLYIFLP